MSEAEWPQITQMNADLRRFIFATGLTGTTNFHNEPYGKQRLIESFCNGGETAGAVEQRLPGGYAAVSGLTARMDDVS